MDPLTACLISGGGGALGNIFATNSTNKANLAIAREQMAFQERMANTAHQREVIDLKAAGLNPILSATGGNGAASPSGSSATMVAPDLGSSAKSGVDTALAAKSMNVQLQNTVADTAAKLEQAKLLGTQTEATAKDVERKSIDNSFQADILGQQLKKSGLDNSFTEQTLGARIQREASESARSKLGILRDDQALKYDYMSDKLLDSMGMMPSTAKRQDAGSLMNSMYDAKDMMSLFTRKFLGR